MNVKQDDINFLVVNQKGYKVEMESRNKKFTEISRNRRSGLKRTDILSMKICKLIVKISGTPSSINAQNLSKKFLDFEDEQVTWSLSLRP